jgi:hypothetical protein
MTKPIVLVVDEKAIVESAIQQAAAKIGSTVMTTENCEVTFKKGRKTANNPEPGLEVTVEFYPDGKPGAVVTEVATEEVKEEAVVEETATATEEVAETATQEAPATKKLF